MKIYKRKLVQIYINGIKELFYPEHGELFGFQVRARLPKSLKGQLLQSYYLDGRKSTPIEDDTHVPDGSTLVTYEKNHIFQ